MGGLGFVLLVAGTLVVSGAAGPGLEFRPAPETLASVEAEMTVAAAVLIASPSDGKYVDAARAIELYRGISSVLHGPNVLGGVVSIEIGRSEVDPDARLNAVQAGVDETGATLFGGRLGRK